VPTPTSESAQRGSGKANCKFEKSDRELDLTGIQVGISQITVAISLLFSADVNPWGLPSARV
jgi:hypothetical protein